MSSLESPKSRSWMTLILVLVLAIAGSLEATEHRVYVAFGDSITKGLGDTDLSNGEGYLPHLSELLPAPGNTVHNAGDPGDTAEDGRNKIDTVLTTYAQATHYLILFGTNDARAATALNEYRSNMRAIIRAIEQAGKVPLLARIPPNYHSTGTSGPFAPPCDRSSTSDVELDQRIRELNQVIDALVSEYNLEIARGRPLLPPDFYGYFESTGIDNQGKSPEFSDCVHPNDSGYRSMAELWLEALEEGPINVVEPQPLTEIYVYKSDIERLSSSTEFQPDDHLVFDVGKNERWTFEALLWVKTTTPTGDFRCLWRGPDGSDVRANIVAYQGNKIIRQASQLGMSVIWSVDYTEAVTVEPIYMKGVFSTRDIAGRIRLEWAQTAASGTTSVYFPSYLEARRVRAGTSN